MKGTTHLCKMLVDDFGDSTPLTAVWMVDALGLSREKYLGAFESIVQYWKDHFPQPHYLTCSAGSLKKIVEKPEDWVIVGRYLAYAAGITYGNGSHQLVENAVPSLIEGGLVHHPEELLTGIEILLKKCNRPREGANSFDNAERMILDGQIKSLDELRRMDIGSFQQYHLSRHLFVSE